MTQLPPPGWYPEPNSPTGQRWWHGTAWTEDVHPPTASDPAGTAAPQVEATAAARDWRDAAMFTSKVVQIDQQGKVFEAASTYAFSGAGGLPLGQAAQVGQRRGGRMLKAMSDMDRSLAVTLRFVDPTGAPVMTLLKPGAVGPQRFMVTDASGSQIGAINQRIRVVREAFEVVIRGERPGALASQNWIDRRFSALDADGQAYAVVHKLYEGYMKARYTSADQYIVEYAEHATVDQRAMALASALAMDIALYSR